MATKHPPITIIAAASPTTSAFLTGRLRVLRDDLVFVVLEISEKRACSAWIRDQIWSNSSFGGGLIGKNGYLFLPVQIALKYHCQSVFPSFYFDFPSSHSFPSSIFLFFPLYTSVVKYLKFPLGLGLTFCS